jgi:hypothetical protein
VTPGLRVQGNTVTDDRDIRRVEWLRIVAWGRQHPRAYLYSAYKDVSLEMLANVDPRVGILQIIAEDLAGKCGVSVEKCLFRVYWLREIEE